MSTCRYNKNRCITQRWIIYLVYREFLSVPGELKNSLERSSRGSEALAVFLHHKAVIQLIYYFERL